MEQLNAVAALIASGWPPHAAVEARGIDPSTLDSPTFKNELALAVKQHFNSSAFPEHQRMVMENTVLAETALRRRLLTDPNAISAKDLIKIARGGAESLGLLQPKQVEVSVSVLARALTDMRSRNQHLIEGDIL